MSASFGTKLQLKLFGEAHGEAVGMVLAGLPAGEEVNLQQLQQFLARRAPGLAPWSTARKEADLPQFLAGLNNNITDGAPLMVSITNTDAKSSDYEKIKHIPRPGHADYAAWLRYGADVDLRGGGRFSGRLTAPLCVAGGICLQILARKGIKIGAHIQEIAGITDTSFDSLKLSAETLYLAGQKNFPVLDTQAGERMIDAIMAAKEDGDSVGGIVEGAAIGLPGGLGGPLFAGLESRLAAALFAIPAVKGIEFGAGFAAARLKGSENNDAFYLQDGQVACRSNNAGGILGGISTGLPLIVRIAFKPTPSIAKTQSSVNLQTMAEAELNINGRHDPCIVPRAVPVVEAVMALVLLDVLLQEEGGLLCRT